jgi:hypothetical protein
MSTNSVGALHDFVTRLENLGLRMNVTRFVDRSVRLNKWRLMNYGVNVEEIDKLWSITIGDDAARLQQLIACIEDMTADSRNGPRQAVGSDTTSRDPET